MEEGQYLEGVIRTWRKDFTECMTQENMSLLNAAMGLGGEAGEVLDEIKKLVFHGVAPNREKIKKEMGDVRYYYTILAHLLNLADDEITTTNNEKLAARYPDGFAQGGGLREEK